MLNLGEKLKSIRKERKLSQKELAEMSGVSLSAIQKFENGIRKPKLESIKNIAKSLQIDVYELLIDDEIESNLLESKKDFLADNKTKYYTGFIYHLYKENHPNKVFNFNNEEIYRSLNEVSKFALFELDKIEKENKLKEKQKDFEEYYNNLKRGE